MRKKQQRKIIIYEEWSKDKENVGMISPWPLGNLFLYLFTINRLFILSSFLNPNKVITDLREFCVLTLFWYDYFDAARFIQYKNPHHHSSEYFFDKDDQRVNFKFRQPDLDGKHWIADHIHIVIGKIDPNSKIKIIKPISKKHVKITNRGTYIERRPTK